MTKLDTRGQLIVASPVPFSKKHSTWSLSTPIHQLIDVSLLTTQEREWLDDYHATVLATLGPLLKDNAEAFAYLVRETRPLESS